MEYSIMKLICLILAIQAITCHPAHKTQMSISGARGEVFKQGSSTNKEGEEYNFPDRKGIFELNKGRDGLIHGDILPAKLQGNPQAKKANNKKTSDINYEPNNENVIISAEGGRTYSGGLTRQKSYIRIDNPDQQTIAEINKRSKGARKLIDGDILPPKQRRKNKASVVELYPTLWTGFSIPIRYDSSLNLAALASIESARVEYELRTCSCFSDYIDEVDYLDIKPLDGCYSHIGRQGGMQNVSIGIGCEKTAIVEHELMHALGVYHEQSRPDRDHYVEIEYRNIEPANIHNFVKARYYLINKDLAPYDFNSVMHYGKNDFSSNGKDTIKTLDPINQDVIGQRRSFSQGDTSELSYVYTCDNPQRLSYTCSFEEETLCDYTQDQNNTEFWVRYNFTKEQTSTSFPQTDATFGMNRKGSFLAINATSEKENATSTIISPSFTSKVPQQCLEFSYYMNLSNESLSSLSVYIASVDEATGEIQDLGKAVTKLTTGPGNIWRIERLTINAPKSYRIAFSANFNKGLNDVIAIDDVNLMDRTCETTYFVIHNYTQNVLAYYPKSTGFFGPTLYTEDGYAFQIKVYPNGARIAKAGYMSLYYYPVQGVNDDQLKWPFEHRVIKLSVVDQNSNTLIRMNENSAFSSDDANIGWEQPTSTPSGVGSPNFMKVSDVRETWNFTKHDSLMISIDVTDMTDWIGQRTENGSIARPTSSFKVECRDNGQQLKPTPPSATTTSGQRRIGAKIAVLGLASALVQQWLR